MSIYPWFTGQASFTTNPSLTAEAVNTPVLMKSLLCRRLYSSSHGGAQFDLSLCEYNGPFVLPLPAECSDHKNDVFLTCMPHAPPSPLVGKYRLVNGGPSSWQGLVEANPTGKEADGLVPEPMDTAWQLLNQRERIWSALHASKPHC